MAQISLGEFEAGFASLEEAFEETSLRAVDEERRPATFDLYQLRGLAFTIVGKNQEALDDMERAVAARVSALGSL